MADSDKNIRITPNRGAGSGILPNIVFTGSSAGSSVITLTVKDDNTISFDSIHGQVFSLDYNLQEGTIWGVSDISGVPLLRASAGATIGIAEFFGSTVGIGTDRPIHKLQSVGSYGIGSTANSAIQFLFDSNYAAGSNIFQVRAANEIRFFNSGNTFYAGLKSASASNATYTLPTAYPSSTGSSYLYSDASGNMSWQPAVRRKTHRIQFGAALNPVSGTDSAVFEIPFVTGGGALGYTSATFRMVRAHIRCETPSATGSSIQIQKYAWNTGLGISAFNTLSTGSTTNILASPLILGGATTHEAFTTTFAGTHVTAVSGDKLRLNWLAASSTQYDFSVNLYMEEDA